MLSRCGLYSVNGTWPALRRRGSSAPVICYRPIPHRQLIYSLVFPWSLLDIKQASCCRSPSSKCICVQCLNHTYDTENCSSVSARYQDAAFAIIRRSVMRGNRGMSSVRVWSHQCRQHHRLVLSPVIIYSQLQKCWRVDRSRGRSRFEERFETNIDVGMSTLLFDKSKNSHARRRQIKMLSVASHRFEDWVSPCSGCRLG
jgi:hypothetical protein